MSGQVRVPANVDEPDRPFFALTWRQVGIVAAAGVVMWLGYRLVSQMLPGIAVVAVETVAAGFVLAVVAGRRDGLTLDVWFWHALRHRRRIRHLIPGPVPDGVPGVARLDLPASGVHADGTLQLDGARHAAIVGVTTIGYGLRGLDDQQAVLDATARWCTGLTGHTQITVSVRPADLDSAADDLEQAAAGLPEPLARLAAGHGAFLRDIADRHQPLQRTVLVTHTGRDAGTATRAAAYTCRMLAATGAQTRTLDAATVTDLLHSAADPSHPTAYGHARPDTIVTGDPKP